RHKRHVNPPDLHVVVRPVPPHHLFMVMADQHRSGSAVNGSSTPVRQSRLPTQWQVGAMSGEMRSRANEFCLQSTQIRMFLATEGDRDAITPFTSTPHGGRKPHPSLITNARTPWCQNTAQYGVHGHRWKVPAGDMEDATRSRSRPSVTPGPRQSHTDTSKPGQIV